MAGPAVLKIDIVTNAKGTQAELAKTDGQLSKLGGTASKAGALLKGGLLAVGVGAVALGKQAYDAASAVQQSFGALESVYGKSAASAKAWAKSAADDVGLASSQYAELSALLGAQLTNMGRSQNEAAKESDKLIKMGADLAATFGGSVADAVSAVSSALKGETDPIERYGASVKQADVNARLASLGLDGLTGSAAKQAQANAVLSLITEQTAKAQGAFGREANTAAGQQARLSANVENLKARLGAGLLPVMTTVFEWINTKLIPGGTALAQTLSRELGPTVSAVGAFIRDRLIPAARSLYEWFVERIVPNIRATVVPIFNQVKATVAGFTRTLDDNSEGLSKLGNFLKKVAGFVSDLAPIVGKLIVGQLKVMGATVDIVVTSISTLVNWIDSAIQKVKDLASAIANNPIVKGAGKLLGGAKGLFAAGPLAGGVGRISHGISPRAGVSAITTAAAGAGSFGGTYGYSSGLGSGPAIVDARRFVNVTVEGALDPVGTADRIRRVLREDEVRRGRASSFAPATGWVG